jgi:RimJ/RimL family protein N-acetyltransferase
VAYEKVEFVLDAPAPVAVPTALRFESAAVAGEAQRMADAIAAAVASSYDRADQDAVARLGAAAVARRYLDPEACFEYERSWWRVAYASDGAVVGFTQPVVFRGCARDGLHEGTIHYIGVVPDRRGRGYLHALLANATATLQALGVWRIFCDTDVVNAPMIRAFERAGYRRGRTRELPLH